MRYVAAGHGRMRKKDAKSGVENAGAWKKHCRGMARKDSARENTRSRSGRMRAARAGGTSPPSPATRGRAPLRNTTWRRTADRKTLRKTQIILKTPNINKQTERMQHSEKHFI